MERVREGKENEQSVVLEVRYHHLAQLTGILGEWREHKRGNGGRIDRKAVSEFAREWSEKWGGHYLDDYRVSKKYGLIVEEVRRALRNLVSAVGSRKTDEYLEAMGGFLVLIGVVSGRREYVFSSREVGELMAWAVDLRETDCGVLAVHGWQKERELVELREDAGENRKLRELVREYEVGLGKFNASAEKLDSFLSGREGYIYKRLLSRLTRLLTGEKCSVAYQMEREIGGSMGKSVGLMQCLASVTGRVKERLAYLEDVVGSRPVEGGERYRRTVEGMEQIVVRVLELVDGTPRGGWVRLSREMDGICRNCNAGGGGRHCEEWVPDSESSDPVYREVMMRMLPQYVTAAQEMVIPMEVMFDQELLELVEREVADASC